MTAVLELQNLERPQMESRNKSTIVSTVIHSAGCVA
jgi:hypothetical protein